MIIRLTIEDDNGEVFWEEERDPCFAFDFKLPPDRPIRGKKYLFYGYVFQPIVKAIYQEQGASDDLTNHKGDPIYPASGQR